MGIDNNYWTKDNFNSAMEELTVPGDNSHWTALLQLKGDFSDGSPPVVLNTQDDWKNGNHWEGEPLGDPYLDALESGAQDTYPNADHPNMEKLLEVINKINELGLAAEEAARQAAAAAATTSSAAAATTTTMMTEDELAAEMARLNAQFADVTVGPGGGMEVFAEAMGQGLGDIAHFGFPETVNMAAVDAMAMNGMDFGDFSNFQAPVEAFQDAAFSGPGAAFEDAAFSGQGAAFEELEELGMGGMLGGDFADAAANFAPEQMATVSAQDMGGMPGGDFGATADLLSAETGGMPGMPGFTVFAPGTTGTGPLV